jgi:hypothetical protein
MAKRNRSNIGRKGQGLIVVPPRYMHSRTGTDAAPFEKFKQMPVPLVNPTHHVVFVSFGMSEEDQSPSTSAAGALQFA